MGTAANVVVGSGIMYVAPIGTALPDVDGSVYPIVWGAGWEQVGYTDDGVEITYSPTYKDIEVDEELSPVQVILVKESATIMAKLAEATILNMNRAISASLYSSSSAAANDIIRLDFGSGVSEEVMVGFEGPAPGSTGLTRVFIAYRAKSVASVGQKYSRQDKVILPLELRILADSTQDAGKRLGMMVDIGTDVAS